MTAITINAKNRSIELTKTFVTASSKFGTPSTEPPPLMQLPGEQQASTRQRQKKSPASR